MLKRFLPLGLFALAVVIYLGAVDAEFLYSWDDQWYVTNNPFIADGLTLSSFTDVWTQFYFATYLPVTMISYNIDYALWGMNATGYHLTNVLLHGVNTVLVYYAVRPLVVKRAGAVAIIAAVFFAVHPLQVEVVAWVSQRKSLLGMMFFLMTWLLHVYEREERSPFTSLVAGWVMFAVTMLAKTSTIGAPLLFFLYDVEWRKLSLVRAVLRAIPYGVISLVAAYLQIRAHDVVDAIKAPLVDTLLGRVRLALLVTWDYVMSMVVPLNLNNRYFYSAAELDARWFGVLLGALVIVGLVVLAVRGGRVGRFAVGGIVMFMLPVSNIIPIAIQRADRYFYFPAMLTFLLLGIALVWLWERLLYEQGEQGRYALSGVVGGLIVACGVLTVQRVEVWANSASLWADHREDYPLSSTGLLNEGVYYYNTGDHIYANYLMTELVEHHPTEWKGYRFLGHIAYTDERYDDAVTRYEQFLAAAPEDEHDTVSRFLGESLFNLGLAAHNDDAFARADDYYQRAAPYLGENAVLYNNIGFNAYRAADYEWAITAYERAIEINPDYTRAYHNLLSAAMETGDSALVTYAEENIERLEASES